MAKKKIYVAYAECGDGNSIIVGEADTLEELKRMARDDELMTSDLDDIKFGTIEVDE